MTINELKAFIEGMGIEGSPTDEQWDRILAKLAETFDLRSFIRRLSFLSCQLIRNIQRGQLLTVWTILEGGCGND